MTVEERADVTAAFLKFRPSGEGVMIEMIDLDSHKGHDSVGRTSEAHRNGVPVPSMERMLEIIEEQRSERRLLRMIRKED
jgi:hypothetical protein